MPLQNPGKGMIRNLYFYTAFACTATRTATPANISDKQQLTADRKGPFQAREGHGQTPANKACRVPPSACRVFTSNPTRTQVRLQAAWVFFVCGETCI